MIHFIKLERIKPNDFQLVQDSQDLVSAPRPQPPSLPGEPPVIPGKPNTSVPGSQPPPLPGEPPLLPDKRRTSVPDSQAYLRSQPPPLPGEPPPPPPGKPDTSVPDPDAYLTPQLPPRSEEPRVLPGKPTVPRPISPVNDAQRPLRPAPMVPSPSSSPKLRRRNAASRPAPMLPSPSTSPKLPRRNAASQYVSYNGSSLTSPSSPPPDLYPMTLGPSAARSLSDNTYDTVDRSENQASDSELYCTVDREQISEVAGNEYTSSHRPSRSTGYEDTYDSLGESHSHAAAPPPGHYTTSSLPSDYDDTYDSLDSLGERRSHAAPPGHYDLLNRRQKEEVRGADGGVYNLFNRDNDDGRGRAEPEEADVYNALRNVSDARGEELSPDALSDLYQQIDGDDVSSIGGPLDVDDGLYNLLTSPHSSSTNELDRGRSSPIMAELGSDSEPDDSLYSNIDKTDAGEGQNFRVENGQRDRASSIDRVSQSQDLAALQNYDTASSWIHPMGGDSRPPLPPRSPSPELAHLERGHETSVASRFREPHLLGHDDNASCRRVRVDSDTRPPRPPRTPSPEPMCDTSSPDSSYDRPSQSRGSVSDGVRPPLPFRAASPVLVTNDTSEEGAYDNPSNVLSTSLPGSHDVTQSSVTSFPSEQSMLTEGAFSGNAPPIITGAPPEPASIPLLICGNSQVSQAVLGGPASSSSRVLPLALSPEGNSGSSETIITPPSTDSYDSPSAPDGSSVFASLPSTVPNNTSLDDELSPSNTASSRSSSVSSTVDEPDGGDLLDSGDSFEEFVVQRTQSFSSSSAASMPRAATMGAPPRPPKPGQKKKSSAPPPIPPRVNSTLSELPATTQPTQGASSAQPSQGNSPPQSRQYTTVQPSQVTRTASRATASHATSVVSRSEQASAATPASPPSVVPRRPPKTIGASSGSTPTTATTIYSRVQIPALPPPPRVPALPPRPGRGRASSSSAAAALATAPNIPPRDRKPGTSDPEERSEQPLPPGQCRLRSSLLIFFFVLCCCILLLFATVLLA